jgi:ergothioneine biosynthesis protein EgtB
VPVVAGVRDAVLAARELAACLADVRSLTDTLAAPLSAEDQTVQSMPDVSPTKWHRAHTTWFFETFVLPDAQPRYREFHPDFGFLFNSYYEAVGDRHPRSERGLLSRPGIDEIARYRRYVDDALAACIDAMPDALLALVELGLHHEQQHQELLLMDIKHVLSRNPMHPAYRDLAVALPGADAPLGWIDHDGGIVEIGHDGRGFAFDNESPRHRTLLEPFAIVDRPVSCGDWLAFIADDGYARADLWLSDGWAAVNSEGWQAPLYWQRDGDDWAVFTLGGLRPVDPAEPVCHVSYYEADAFARWAGARLPTEAEWEHAAGRDAAHGRYLDLDVLHPRPPAPGEHAMFGDVWEWTASAYLPYPGFAPAAGAVGEYNGKFMVNQHVLRGGCCVTPPRHVRPTYRNFFPPSARWAFSGLRLARDA